MAMVGSGEVIHLKAITIFTTDVCPKCRALKVFLKTIGATFTTKDMAKSMPYLSAFDGWPQDNTAPILEVKEPGKEPVFYDHYSLFDRNGLKKDYIISEILGLQDATSN